MYRLLMWVSCWYWRRSRAAEQTLYPTGVTYVPAERPRARRRAVRLATVARWLEDKARR
jgi:hypothetical protein